MTTDTLRNVPLWAYPIVFLLVWLILDTVAQTTGHLWQAWREKTNLPPYNWATDDGLLDVWALDAEGEVLTVGHLIQWRYK